MMNKVEFDVIFVYIMYALYDHDEESHLKYPINERIISRSSAIARIIFGRVNTPLFHLG